MNKHLNFIICLFVVGLITSTSYGQASLQPVPVTDGMAKLSPENTSIQFVGIHVGDDPKPRLGGFEKFTGSIKVADGEVTGLNLNIKIGSIWTQFDKLTTHLLNEDFFDVDQFGESSFESTGMQTNNLGETEVVGNLTLMGATKEIRFPVEINMNDNGVTLTSEFKINRAMFGMDKMTSGVDKVVSVKFVVGHKTVVVPAGEANPLDAKPAQQEEEVTLKDPVTVTVSMPNMT